MKKFQSGKYEKQIHSKVGEYACFVPFSINRQYVLSNPKILYQVENAGRLLGELNAYSTLVPDINFFIQMHVQKEAIYSNLIEGTHTEIEESFLQENEISPEKRDDWHEVQNYVKAMNFSIDSLNTLPLSIRLLNQTHKVLLSGVRGQQKQPGEVRTMQNWLGSKYICDAQYIPPAPKYLPDLLSDMEKFWHNKNVILPALIKTAITHYQFETIHPYNDGNGRIGRLLITLQLLDNKLLKVPTLYISDYFEKNRNRYFNAFTKTRKDNDLEGWLLFFFEAICDSSKKSISTLEEIISLRNKYNNQILKLGPRSENVEKLIQYMYSRPVVKNSEVMYITKLSYNSARVLTKDLENLGILKEITDYKRNKKYSLYEYINLFR